MRGEGPCPLGVPTDSERPPEESREGGLEERVKAKADRFRPYQYCKGTIAERG